jgi:hypothetical protein
MVAAFLVCVHLCPSVVSPSLADSLLAAGHWYDAVTEYRRAEFDCPDSSGLAGLKLGIALCLEGATDDGVARLHLVRENHPALALAATRSLAGFLSAGGRDELAAAELEDALLFLADSAGRRRLERDLAWLDLEQGDLAAARLRYLALGDSMLASAIAEVERRPRRSPTVALLLSSVVPGSGEVYAGRFAHGVASLAVTAGSAWACYEAAKSNDYLAASLLFSLLFLRFYSGSRANAQYFAEQWNEKVERSGVEQVRREYRPEPDWLSGARFATGLALPAAIPRTTP